MVPHPLAALAQPGSLQLLCVLGREQEIVDVGNVINSCEVTLAVAIQDPRRGNLDPQVAVSDAAEAIFREMKRRIAATR
jgi:hypothetical protein